MPPMIVVIDNWRGALCAEVRHGHARLRLVSSPQSSITFVQQVVEDELVATLAP